MSAFVIESKPTGEYRWWTPIEQYCPAKLQQRHWVLLSDGSDDFIWITEKAQPE
jgi:hypothetical protein